MIAVLEDKNALVPLCGIVIRVPLYEAICCLAVSEVKDVFCRWTICGGGKPPGFGFGVGDDPGTHVGLDIEGEGARA